MERAWSLSGTASDHDLLNSLLKGNMGSMASLPPLGNASELEDFLRKIPSSTNLSSAPPSSESQDAALTPAGGNPASIPRVASLEYLRNYLNDQSAPNVKDASDGPSVPTPDATRTAHADHHFGGGSKAFGGEPSLQLPILTIGGPVSRGLPTIAPSYQPPVLSPQQQQMLAAALMHSQAAPQGVLPYLAAWTANAAFNGNANGNGSTTIHFSAPSPPHAAPASLPDSAHGGGSEREGGPKSGASSGVPEPHYSGNDDKGRARKERRMLSNRESARRSRKRKQEHVVQLEQEMSGIAQALMEAESKCRRLEGELEHSRAVAATLQADNTALRAQLAAAAADATCGMATGKSSGDYAPLELEN